MSFRSFCMLALLGTAGTGALTALGNGFRYPDELDAAHIAADASWFTANTILHKQFISSHKKFIFNEIKANHKEWLKFFNKELCEEINAEAIKNRIEKKHTFIRLIPSNLNSDQKKGFSLLMTSCITKDVLYGIARKLLKEEGHLQQQSTLHGGLRAATTFFDYLAHIFYGLKTEGLNFVARNLVAFLATLGITGLVVWTAMCFQAEWEDVWPSSKFFFKRILQPALAIKNFNNYCLKTWTEYVIANHKTLETVLREYEDACKSNDPQQRTMALKALEKFIGSAHDEIPLLLQVIR